MAQTVQNIILDTSVIVKWFFPENKSEQALEYLNSLSNQIIEITIPHLTLYEIGNVCVTRKLEVKETEIISNKISELNLNVVDVPFIAFKSIYEKAIRLNLSFYDASYITLMEEYRCSFVTADEKLYRKVFKYFPAIQLL